MRHAQRLKAPTVMPGKPNKIEKTMGEFKTGSLHSGSDKGPQVTNPKQAIAIALSQQKRANARQL